MYIYEHCTLTSSYVCKKLLLTRPRGDLVTGGGEIGKGRIYVYDNTNAY